MSDAGQMRRRLERRLLDNPFDRRVGAIARRSTRAVGDRNKGRRQRLEPSDAGPELLLGFVGLGRRELERDPYGRRIVDQIAQAHAASACDLAGERASQILTVSFPAPDAMVSLTLD